VLAGGRPRAELHKGGKDLDPFHADDVGFEEIGGFQRVGLRTE
jgi:hypothetical protein